MVDSVNNSRCGKIFLSRRNRKTFQKGKIYHNEQDTKVTVRNALERVPVKGVK
jgi:hypothetical protein